MSTTLSDLITATRDRIDEVSASRWTDAEITRYINQRISWLQSRIETFNPDFFLRVQTPTAASGEYKMGLPTCMFGSKLRAVRVYQGTTDAALNAEGYRLDPRSHEELFTRIDETNTPQGYAMFAKQFEWGPKLPWDATFRIVYGIKETTLTGANSTLSYIKDEWSDVISNGAAIDCLIKIGAWDNVNGLNEINRERLAEIAEDAQPSDPIMIPQTDIDDYTISD